MLPLTVTRHVQKLDGNLNFIKECIEFDILDKSLMNEDLIKELIIYYDGINPHDLHTLWLDNYNSLMALDLKKEKHNTTTFIILHKLKAIIAIVREKY